MKLAVKFFSLMMLLAFVGFFVMKRPDGQPWLTVDDLMPNMSAAKTEARAIAKPGEVYRWQDDEGMWHFSDEPPVKQVALDPVKLQPDRNLIQGLRNKEPAQEASAEPEQDQPGMDLPLPTTIPIKDIPKLLDDARKVQDLMNERQKQLEKVL